jgi:hypothetical protein
VQKRGGPKSLEEDASELANIARADGTLSDKAADTKALKEPGAHQQASAATTDEQS